MKTEIGYHGNAVKSVLSMTSASLMQAQFFMENGYKSTKLIMASVILNEDGVGFHGNTTWESL